MNLIENMFPSVGGVDYSDIDKVPPPSAPIDFSEVHAGATPTMNIPNPMVAHNMPMTDDIADQIGKVESGGKYDAVNPNSSAVGKYQFLWNKWGSEISSITGVKSKDDFRHNPDAQESFYKYYENKYMIPAIERLKTYNKAGLTDEQLAKLYHFKGEGGARDYLINGSDSTSANNLSIPTYLKHRMGQGGQIGGLWNTNKKGFTDSVNNANMNVEFVNRFYGKDQPSLQTNQLPGTDMQGKPWSSYPATEHSSHLMGWDGANRVYPRIVKEQDNKLHYLPTEDAAWDYANKNGEYIDFKTSQQAEWYSDNGYKIGTGVNNSITPSGVPYNDPKYKIKK